MPPPDDAAVPTQAPASQDKALLRRRFVAARRDRTSSTLDAARAAIRSAVLTAQRERGWQCVAAYVPMATEPGSTELLDALVSRGVRVLVPVLRDEGVLGWTDWDPLRPVSWDGRPVPGADTDAAQPEGNAEAIATADAVLVPALAVAADGTRLGRGAGCYDRALRLARRGAPLGAVVFDGELCDRLPADPWDVAVTAVVSPQGWQDLAQPR